MSGIDDDLLNSADGNLPNTEALQIRLLDLVPDFISAAYPPDSSVPIAAVCLIDAGRMMQEARYALLQAKVHLLHWRRRNSEPRAVWHAQFYAADIGLRLYAGGEHIAESIVAMYSLSPADLTPFKGGVVSRQAMVGKYMLKERSADPAAHIVKSLADSEAWSRTIRYRNDWVHEQAPSVKGLGAVWERRKRWQPLPQNSGHRIDVGVGDNPKTTIDAVVGDALAAFVDYVDAIDRLSAVYFNLIAAAGLTRDGNGLTLVFRPSQVSGPPFA